MVTALTADTYAAAAVAASARSLLSGQASSPLMEVRAVPGRSISGPEDWGPDGAAGDVVGRAASGACCRSAEEVAGLGGLGEDEESAGGAELC